jgi:poly-gamma-glutamate synthesis protein (capsule biosynthesis protein)
MARACERAGADLLIGHHPGKIQGIDYINEMPVIYSLGNLIAAGAARTKTYDALIVQAVFDLNGESRKPSLRLIPVLASSAAEEKNNNCHPAVAQDGDRQRILKTIQKDTGFLLILDQ